MSKDKSNTCMNCPFNGRASHVIPRTHVHWYLDCMFCQSVLEQDTSITCSVTVCGSSRWTQTVLCEMNGHMEEPVESESLTGFSSALSSSSGWLGAERVASSGRRRISFYFLPCIFSPPLTLLFDNGIFSSVTKLTRTSKEGCYSLAAVCVAGWAGSKCVCVCVKVRGVCMCTCGFKFRCWICMSEL